MSNTTSTPIYTNNDEGRKKIILNVVGIDKRFTDYCVLTTHKEIMKIRNTFLQRTKIENTQTFKELWHNVTKYTDEQLNDIYQEYGTLYQDWCSDVLVFFCVRLVLLNKPIDMSFIFCLKCKKEDTNQDFTKCSGCKRAYYCSSECQHNDWKKHKQYCKCF